MKVFISSTYEDLKDYRQAAIKVVNHYKWIPLVMEFFISQPQEPTRACEKEISECDVFVGIYAHRYGFIPGGETKSIIQLEYERAKSYGKPCLCFIIEKDFPWNPQFIEHEKQKELRYFLGEVKRETTCTFVTTPADFEIKLSTSIGKLMAKKRAAGEPGEKQADTGDFLPRAPTPLIAHPYPMPTNFTGRDAEQAMLSNWFFNEQQPVLVLEAIGGMGKTALTWVWLQRHILEPDVKIDGVFWWSFYEAPFELFLQELDNYVLGKRKPGAGSLLSADLTELQAALHHRRFLLVLDGLERTLRGYSGMEAMYARETTSLSKPGIDTPVEKQLREPVHPLATRFLQHLASGQGQSRVLITSRLIPFPLEDLAGVKYVFLQGLAPGEGVWFLRSEGVKGTAAELEQAGRVYDFHPLMLKLLASAIKRSRDKDVQGAYRLNLIDTHEPHKILATSFNMLTEKEREVASRLSVFRVVFNFESAKALFPKLEADRLWDLLSELRGLGFLFYDEKHDRFDIHPILRSFLYHELTDKAGVHTLAVQYFQALPRAEKIVTLEDLAPAIELYHHLVKAGKFDEARELFRDRIYNLCYYQLSTYNLIIELIRELFPDGEDRLPRLTKEPAQSWVLNALAIAYTLSGQPVKAFPLFLKSIFPGDEIIDKEGVSVSLGNIAQNQVLIGQSIASITHLRKRILMSLGIGNEFSAAVGHQELGLVLAYQGRTADEARLNKSMSNGISVEDELAKASDYWEKVNEYQGLSITCSYRCISILFQVRVASLLYREEKLISVQSLDALKQARKALEFTTKSVAARYPYPRDFIQAYWLLGETLVQCSLTTGSGKVKPFEIPFYDEYFQQQIEVVIISKGNELAAAERCLNEALRRCRKINLVEFEPGILLAMAHFEWAKISSQPQNNLDIAISSLEPILDEAQEIAKHARYRFKLADLHLFCSQVLVQLKQEKKLLGLDAHEHLQKTKEYAVDVSEFSQLYQSPDPEFYKGIPEYDMLKRGPTEEERIRNGYYAAYRIAEELERRL